MHRRTCSDNAKHAIDCVSPRLLDSLLVIPIDTIQTLKAFQTRDQVRDLRHFGEHAILKLLLHFHLLRFGVHSCSVRQKGLNRKTTRSTLDRAELPLHEVFGLCLVHHPRWVAQAVQESLPQAELVLQPHTHKRNTYIYI